MLSRLLHSLRSPSLTTMGACFSSTKSSTVNWAGPPRVSTAAGVAAAKADVRAVVDEHHCGPLFLRLAWHDAGTFDAKMPSFPSRGGATGSIRFKNELAHGANAGLNKALDFLTPVAAAHADVSFADLIQLAGAVAVEATGGPKLAMRYGRKDAAGPLSEVKEGNLPAGGAPWPAPSTDAASHLRAVFHRMGMSDAEIVALSGAHTIGRARTTRSGFGKESTKYTDDTAKGTPGGTSWTPDFQTFNNSYFTEVKKAVTGSGDPDLLVLDTDKVIFTDPKFKPVAEKYATNEAAFLADYAAAHVKLAELGAEWESEIKV